MKNKKIYYFFALLYFSVFLLFTFESKLLVSLIFGFFAVLIIFTLNQLTGVNKRFDKK